MEIDAQMADEYRAGHRSLNDMFVWTYTSPEFPMSQVSFLSYVIV